MATDTARRSAASRAASPGAAAPGRARPGTASQTTAPIYEYLARKGGPIRKKDAVVIGPALVALREEAGRLDPPTVVEAASDPDSPLHSYFTWDDEIAAQAHRLWQARQLLGSIEMRPVGAGIAPVRAFYNVSEPDEPRVYLPLGDVFSDEAQLRRVLTRFHNDLRAMRVRYLAFRRTAEFAGYEAVFSAIEEALRD